jgi:hypothetical protein
MKEVIKVCLDRYNNTSHSNDELSNLIIGAIKTQGWYLNMSDKNDVCEHNNNINSTCSECDEEQARESWVCGICNESTYAVEWDHVGSGTNHLSCELEIEMKDDKDADYIFESPDGGETVYKRKFGEDKRELYKVKDD